MATKTSSFTCPNCGKLVEIDFQDFFTKSSFQCKNCHTQFNLNKEEGKNTIEELKKMTDQIEKLKDRKK